MPVRKTPSCSSSLRGPVGGADRLEGRALRTLDVSRQTLSAWEPHVKGHLRATFPRTRSCGQALSFQASRGRSCHRHTWGPKQPKVPFPPGQWPTRPCIPRRMPDAEGSAGLQPS